jgi:tRNA G26 N,N-dimethylase Trm1
LMNQMRAEKRFFDVIDLDPYGSAIPFLESAL